MDVSTLTVHGKLQWDVSQAGLVLKAGYVLVEQGGAFECGTRDTPMRLRATINITDVVARGVDGATHAVFGRRFLAGSGLGSRVDIHGAPLSRTWTLLAADADAAALLGGVRTMAGQRIVGMAAEVVNLERSVVVTGHEHDTRRFHDTQQGIHTVQGFGGSTRVTYTRVEYCGQRGVLGRYCLHMHLLGHCPSCEFTGNAVYESHQLGITVHGTHDALVDQNVLFDARGVALYIEDGNEMNNTLSNNVAFCSTYLTCKVLRETGLYMLGMNNHLLRNRIALYQNTFFTPGGGQGQGPAWGKVCPRHMPFGNIVGNVGHGGGRFGMYLDNQYPRQVAQDSDGYVDKSTCDEYKPDGTDNGQLSLVQDALEYHQLFMGQYTLGDIQFLRYTSVNNNHAMYWKEGKDFALTNNGDPHTPAVAHIKDSRFVHDNTNPKQAYSWLNVLAPSGPFQFVLENVSYFGGPVGVALAAGQHCGLAGHNGGQHGSLCNVMYLLRRVSFEGLDGYSAARSALGFRGAASTARLVQFGASGGNPIMPTFMTDDPSDMSLGGARTLISRHLDGFASIRGCEATTGNGWGGATACAQNISFRNLKIWSARNQSSAMQPVRLMGPGYHSGTPNLTDSDFGFPRFGQNWGFLSYDGLKKGYGAVVQTGQNYSLVLETASSADTAITYSSHGFRAGPTDHDEVYLSLSSNTPFVALPVQAASMSSYFDGGTADACIDGRLGTWVNCHSGTDEGVVLDARQDIVGAAAAHNATTTTMWFARRFDTGDTNGDRKMDCGVGKATTLLFAFGASNKLGYHGKNKGHKAVVLLPPHPLGFCVLRQAIVRLGAVELYVVRGYTIATFGAPEQSAYRAGVAVAAAVDATAVTLSPIQVASSAAAHAQRGRNLQRRLAGSAGIEFNVTILVANKAVADGVADTIGVASFEASLDGAFRAELANIGLSPPPAFSLSHGTPVVLELAAVAPQPAPVSPGGTTPAPPGEAKDPPLMFVVGAGASVVLVIAVALVVRRRRRTSGGDDMHACAAPAAGATKAPLSRGLSFTAGYPAASVGVPLPPLPDGWEREYSNKGKVFFVNRATGETSWEAPPVMPSANEFADVLRSNNSRLRVV
eukprot:g340.t1